MIRLEAPVVAAPVRFPVDPNHLVRLTRHFTFDAAHRLPAHPGRCHNLHGHSWEVDVTIQGKINPETGMLFDFGDLKHIGNALFDEQWDHSVLLYKEDPVVLALQQAIPGTRIVVLESYPTSEYLTQLAFAHFQLYLPEGVRVNSVKIWETRNCCAETQSKPSAPRVGTKSQ